MSTPYPMLAALAAAAPPTLATPTITVPLVKVVLSLGAVVGVILLFGWMARRAQSRVRAGGRRLRCLETLTGGAKERVLLIQAGDRQLLVGVAPGHMRTLLGFEQPIDDDQAPAPPAAPAGSFGDLLKRWGPH